MGEVGRTGLEAIDSDVFTLWLVALADDGWDVAAYSIDQCTVFYRAYHSIELTYKLQIAWIRLTWLQMS